MAIKSPSEERIKELESRLQQMEETLRVSVERNRLATSAAKVGVWDWNITTGDFYLDPNIKALLGYTDNEIPNDIERWVKYVHPEDSKAVMEAAQECLDGKIPEYIFEHRMLHKDGSIRWILVRGKAIRSESGSAVRLIGTDTDITDRKLAEEALTESEEKFRMLSEMSPLGISLIGQDGRYKYVNPQFQKLFGYTIDDIPTGKEWFRVAYPNRIYRRAVLESWFGDHKKAGIWQSRPRIYTVTCRDGSRKDIHFRPVTMENQDQFVIYEDITERKHAYEALRESEEKYRTVLMANPDPVVVYDMEGKVSYFNPSFTRVFGWTLKDSLRKKMDVFVPEEVWPETKMMIEKVLAGERLSGFKTCRYTKNGEIIPVSISGSIYKDQDGNPIGSIINLRDISDQKKMEARLHQAQKMEAMGTLAGGIAHDFNNLLMGIQGRTSVMLMGSDTSPLYLKHLKEIQKYVKNAANLTHQLLGFARGGKYEIKSTDLNELIKNQNRMFGRTRKEINIQEKFEENLWTVETDQGQIEQVILNIYINAWQAMPVGGNLYVQSENTIIGEKDEKPYNIKAGRYVKISITDTGVGMDEATRQRMFDPFFTTKEKERGTGLGLASAYGIIKNHDGFINVYSEKGEGTTLNIYFPASERESVKEEEIDEELIRGTETVLLVDDEDMIIEVCQEFLGILCYEALIAKNGKEAIEIYSKNSERIDVVILDMIMPEMGGGETYDKLKKINPDIKVLLASGYSINGQATDILNRGCNSFIQKPFTIVDLSKKIREVLGKK